MKNDRDRLIELLAEAEKEWKVYFSNSLLKGETRSKTLDEFIADHILANGVIVPPCRVGDKVYCIEYNLKIIEEYTVSGYTIKNGKLALFVFRGIYSAVVSEWFLTKEEAEKALKERDKNESIS